jgi:hypothetical protein
VNILVLGAGEQAISVDRGMYPLWLAESGGTSFLERHLEEFRTLNPRKFIYVFRKADVELYHLDEIVRQLTPGCAVVSIARETQGAACSALLAIGEIDMNAELMITTVTDMVECDIAAVVQSFKARGAQAGLVTFDSLHPRYSYVRCIPDGTVIEAAEKRPISRHASTGLYWFAKAGHFFEAVRKMILKDGSVQGQFYICPALNELILDGMLIMAHPVPVGQYHPIKSPQDVGAFEHTMELRDVR